ncbi:MAG: hypothetical protein C5B53_01690 [Candidatus Melainabacteria bacterium]|nr:MAG: hypothetical protein C5B53_01690 [Candidatus Melainabacteria bacterium]
MRSGCQVVSVMVISSNGAPSIRPFNTEEYSSLATLFLTQGRATEAEDLYKQALELARLANGKGDSELTNRLEELGWFYARQDKYHEAEPLFERVLDLRSHEASPNDDLLIRSLEQLATAYEKTGKAKKAEELLTRLLAKQEDRYGTSALYLIPTLDRLAEFCLGQDHYEKAETLYLRILAIAEFYYGTYSVEINGVVLALINVFEKQGKTALAEFMLQKQEAILAAIHGPDALCVAACLLRRGEILTKVRRHEEAQRVYLRALTIYQKAYGSDSSSVNALRRRLSQL